MNRSVAVVDLGKTNAKVAIVDTAAAQELAVLTEPSPTNTTLYPSLDQKRIESFVVDALHTLSTTYPIDALTVTTHGATAALVEPSGELALPVIDYEFEGIDEARAEYDLQRPAYEETGSPSLPGGLNIGAQLFWQKKHFPFEFAKASHILTWPQYWVNKLGGDRCNDLTSLGCHTDLINPYQGCYSSLVNKQEWTNLLPPTRKSGQICGLIDASIATQIGLDPSTQVHVGIHDSNASLVPHLYTQKKPFSVVSTGTWFISMAIGGHKTALDETKDHMVNINAQGHCVPTARFMGGRERELMSLVSDTNESVIDTVLDNTVDQRFILPSVVQNTGPYPSSTSNWKESKLGSNEQHHACHVSLYLAMMTWQCLESIGAQGPIYLEGPMTQDAVFAQALMVASENPVMLSSSITGTSIGAAMLIAPPQMPITYKNVTISSERKAKLKRYIENWRLRLNDHSI